MTAEVGGGGAFWQAASDPPAQPFRRPRPKRAAQTTVVMAGSSPVRESRGREIAWETVLALAASPGKGCAAWDRASRVGWLGSQEEEGHHHQFMLGGEGALVPTALSW